MSQISGHEPQEQPIFLVQSLLHPLARLCPENAHSGLGLAGTRSMCFSPVEISLLWWCLTWVCDLLSPLGNHLEPLAHFPFSFVCLISLWNSSVLPNMKGRSASHAYGMSHSMLGDLRLLPTPHQALSRSNTSSPSVAPLCRSEICNHSSQNLEG